ncbi:MAG: LuxR C-terminal-related transcriptional regulator [Marmoricola sp.]
MADWRAEYVALTAADRAQALSPDELERLAVAAFLLGHDDEIADLRTRAFDAYLDAGRVEDAAECAFWLGFYLQNRGDTAQASGWASQVKRLIPDDPASKLSGRLQSREAAALMFAGNFAEALPIFERTSDIAAAAHDLDGLVLAEIGRGRCLAMLGNDSEAGDVFDEVMVHVIAGRVAPQVTGLAYCSMVDMCMRWFDLKRAHEWTQTFNQWAEREIGMLAYRGTCLVHRAEISQVLGDWPKAAEEAQQACELLATTHEFSVGAAHYRVGELARLRGRFDAAEEAYARAAQFGAEVQPGLGLLRLAQRRPDAATSGLDRALAEHRRAREHLPLLAARIDVALALDDLEGAAGYVDELLGSIDAMTPTFIRALAAYAHGALLLAQGSPSESLPELRHAWRLWDELEIPYESARTRMLVARACRDLGDHDACHMEIAAARSVFERLGAAVDLARCGDAEASTGVLTARECEVLRLVATGATNRVIATRLVLSEKTVARHLSNIFEKLDVPSRAAATAYAYEHDLA